jgi:hypothetical protein
LENWKIVAWIGVACLVVGLIFVIIQLTDALLQLPAYIESYYSEWRRFQGSEKALVDKRNRQIIIFLFGSVISSNGAPFVVLGFTLIIFGYIIKRKTTS